MKRSIPIFFACIMTSTITFAQGLVKEEAPDQFKIHVPEKNIGERMTFGSVTFSTDSLVTSRWNSVIKSFEKLDYLKKTGLITQQEFLDSKARLNMEIQKIKAIKSRKVHRIGADI